MNKWFSLGVLSVTVYSIAVDVNMKLIRLKRFSTVWVIIKQESGDQRPERSCAERKSRLKETTFRVGLDADHRKMKKLGLCSVESKQSSVFLVFHHNCRRESTPEFLPSPAPRWLMGPHSPVCVLQGLAVLSPLISANGTLGAERQHKHTIVYLASSCQKRRTPVKTDFSLGGKQTDSSSSAAAVISQSHTQTLESSLSGVI